MMNVSFENPYYKKEAVSLVFNRTYNQKRIFFLVILYISQFDPFELLGITNYALPIRSFDWCYFPALFPTAPFLFSCLVL